MAEAETRNVHESPLVKAALAAFPDAKLLEHGRMDKGGTADDSPRYRQA